MNPTQCKMARAALQIGVRELGKAAGVAPLTVSRFENSTGQSIRASALEAQAKMQRALEAAGVTFLDAEPDLGVGVRVAPGTRFPAR